MDMTCMMPRQEKLLSVQQVVGTMVVDWLLTSYLPTRDMSSGRQPQTAYTPVLPEPNCLQADLTSISAYTGLEILSTRLLMAGMPVRRDCAHLVSGTTILQREVSILPGIHSLWHSFYLQHDKGNTVSSGGYPGRLARGDCHVQT